MQNRLIMPLIQLGDFMKRIWCILTLLACASANANLLEFTGKSRYDGGHCTIEYQIDGDGITGLVIDGEHKVRQRDYFYPFFYSLVDDHTGSSTDLFEDQKINYQKVFNRFVFTPYLEGAIDWPIGNNGSSIDEGKIEFNVRLELIIKGQDLNNPTSFTAYEISRFGSLVMLEKKFNCDQLSQGR